MLQVTEGASQELKRILESVSREPEQFLRLVVDQAGGLRLALDSEREGDQVVENEGTKVMFIEPGIVEQMKGVTLDFKDTAEGAQLILDRGNSV